MKALGLGLIVVGSLVLGSVGWAVYTQNVEKSLATPEDTAPSAIKLETEEGKEKPSVLQFTDNENKPIGQLRITDTISFQGQLDTSGLIFMSYIAAQMGLHCDELKKNSPLQVPVAKEAEAVKKK